MSVFILLSSLQDARQKTTIYDFINDYFDNNLIFVLGYCTLRNAKRKIFKDRCIIQNKIHIVIVNQIQMRENFAKFEIISSRIFLSTSNSSSYN